MFRKTAFAAALIAAFAASPAFAKNQVYVYGQIDIGSSATNHRLNNGVLVDQFSLAGASPRSDSFIGFAAVEHISPAVSAGAVFEMSILSRQPQASLLRGGSAHTNPNVPATRQAYVFLSHEGIGGIRLGTFRNGFSEVRSISPTSDNVVGGQFTGRHGRDGVDRFSSTSQNTLEVAIAPAWAQGTTFVVSGSAENVLAQGAIGNGHTSETMTFAATHESDNWTASLVHGESRQDTRLTRGMTRMQNTALAFEYRAESMTFGAIGEHMTSRGALPATGFEATALEVFAVRRFGNSDAFVSVGSGKSQSHRTVRTTALQAGLVKHLSSRTSLHAAAGIERASNGARTIGYGLGLTHAF